MINTNNIITQFYLGLIHFINSILLYISLQMLLVSIIYLIYLQNSKSVLNLSKLLFCCKTICINQYLTQKSSIIKEQILNHNYHSKMACSKYQYVKQFQEHRTALFDTYMVVRIDGRSFTKFCQVNAFKKPNDIRAINLMNEAARSTMNKFPQIFLGYGQSDQYSFALPKKSQLFSRRIDKIQTCIVSYFTASYIMNWQKYFPDQASYKQQQMKNEKSNNSFSTLKQIPSFDCRITQYPNQQTLMDYFRWRQVDCHINNLYNTLFWCLVDKKKLKRTQVEQILKNTNSGQKNQMLFQDFGINYSQIQQVYRRGTTLCYRQKPTLSYKKQTTMKLPINIRKQLKISLNNIKMLSSNMQKMSSKLEQSQVQADNITFKQLFGLQEEIKTVSDKYQEIWDRTDGDKMKRKQGKVKYELQQIYQDMIRDEFWETIKME